MSFPRARRLRAVLRHPLRGSIIQALCDVTFQLRRGEILAVVGLNGAGKSTLCRILAGLLIPTSGSIELGGTAVTCPKQLRGEVGFCWNEERSFLWRITGRENLRLFAALNGLGGGLAKALVDDLIDLLHLEECAEQPFMYWSTGMRQRLNLARSLLTDPAVLILDEPTRSLDPLAARELCSLVRGNFLSRRERTIIWCTHALSEVAALNGTVAILRQGKVVATGDNEAIIAYAARHAGGDLCRTGGSSSEASPLDQTYAHIPGNPMEAIQMILSMDSQLR